MRKELSPAFVFIAALLGGCIRGPTEEIVRAPEPPDSYRIYVTNEASGDLSVIDSARHDVIATVKLGKRPCGIHASPDGKTSASR